jgi:hypothetical protein
MLVRIAGWAAVVISVILLEEVFGVSFWLGFSVNCWLPRSGSIEHAHRS